MRGHYVGTLIDLLTEMGVDRNAFLAECGLVEDDLRSDNLIDQHQLLQATQLAADYTRDSAIGLQTGLRLNINTHGPLGYAAMASENFEQALHLLMRYYKVQAPHAHFALERHGRNYHLICQPRVVLPEMPWLTAEFLVTSIYTSSEFLLNSRLAGVEVSFRHATPPHVALYDEAFAVPYRLEQPFDGLVIPVSLTRLPLPSADAVAASLFEKRCEAIRREFDRISLAERIREMQSAHVGAFLSQADVAERLHVSVSTLHRKLADEGVAYKDLLAAIKRDLALQQLRESELTVDQIAQLLGFSDASNFRRAFVSWTGRTPSEVRQQNRPANDDYPR